MTEKELLIYLNRINQNIEGAINIVASMVAGINLKSGKEDSFDRVEWSKKALDKQTKQ